MSIALFSLMLSWNSVVRQLDPRAEMQLDVFARWATAEIYIEKNIELHYSSIYFDIIRICYTICMIL